MLTQTKTIHKLFSLNETNKIKTGDYKTTTVHSQIALAIVKHQYSTTSQLSIAYAVLSLHRFKLFPENSTFAKVKDTPTVGASFIFHQSDTALPKHRAVQTTTRSSAISEEGLILRCSYWSG